MKRNTHVIVFASTPVTLRPITAPSKIFKLPVVANENGGPRKAHESGYGNVSIDFTDSE